MSGAARQRGRGRAGGEETSDTSSRRGGPPGAQPSRAPGGFDGPASRGSASASASGVGSQGRRPSNPPSVGSGGRSPTQSQGSFQPPSTVQQQRITGDPARDQDKQPKLTDALKNLDLPASFYNIDQTVRLHVRCHRMFFLVLHTQYFLPPLSYNHPTRRDSRTC